MRLRRNVLLEAASHFSCSSFPQLIPRWLAKAAGPVQANLNRVAGETRKTKLSGLQAQSPSEGPYTAIVEDLRPHQQRQLVVFYRVFNLQF